MSLPESLNMDYLDAQYAQWKADPASVSRDWQYFFKGFEIAFTGKVAEAIAPATSHSSRQANVEQLIFSYRNLGHLLACMDPLDVCPTEHPLLELEMFGLSIDDLDSHFHTDRFSENGSATLKDILAWLKQTYCRSVGVEYMHIQDPQELAWLQEKMEPNKNRSEISPQGKKQILKRLVQAALFESFLNKKYLGVTRFSLEGGDALIPLLDAVVEQVSNQGCREIILGMAHRGRLNVQTHILNKPYEEIFREFESCYDPDQLMGSGDVKYHNGYMADVQIGAAKPIRMVLVNNPSHLEAVDPVVEGMARARQEVIAEDRLAVVPILIHGDAAFAGQGVVAETLNMSQLKGYATGGTVHLIINNQIGYTTLPEDARSTRYSTDIAKMLMVPIFHVHGENPEATVHVAQLAAEYRNRFGKDVVIDLVCYRRYGHNEGDEPYFTQPTMYERIKTRPAAHELYAENLQAEGLIDKQWLSDNRDDIQQSLDQAYAAATGDDCTFPVANYFEAWSDVKSTYTFDGVEKGLDPHELIDLSKKLNRLSKSFSLNPKLKRLLAKRLSAVVNGEGIDWANAESLAFGSLLMEGHPIRLSGQDVGRGTFSQRHAVLFDAKSGQALVPLNHLTSEQAPFMVHNSLLAEAGVLGFEYGYSVTRPESLVLWEAQFGDFANNAQAVFDLFIASGQTKWERLSGLTLLLPHGWEGLGPEHSSARLERFLQLCAGNNIQVCYPSTPAQYFHLLRRQIKAPYRKPLIMMTPKSLLRHPLAVSNLSRLASGQFEFVLDDPEKPVSSTQIILCSGKIFYQLSNRRSELEDQDTAIIRLEQFYPFPEKQLTQILGQYNQAKSWHWVQEEPENMGGWQFVRSRLAHVVGKHISYIGRRSASSPATGFPAIYKREQEQISDQAIGRRRDERSAS